MDFFERAARFLASSQCIDKRTRNQVALVGGAALFLSQDEPYTPDHIWLGTGWGGRPEQMAPVKAAFLARYSFLKPDQIHIAQYSNPDNPVIEQLVEDTLRQFEKEGIKGRVFMEGYSASGPVGLSMAGEYWNDIPSNESLELRLRHLAAGEEGRTDVYRLIKKPGFENQALPRLAFPIDHLHGTNDEGIYPASARRLAKKYRYRPRLRFVPGIDHRSVLEHPDVTSFNFLQADPQNP